MRAFIHELPCHSATVIAEAALLDEVYLFTWSMLPTHLPQFKVSA